MKSRRRGKSRLSSRKKSLLISVSKRPFKLTDPNDLFHVFGHFAYTHSPLGKKVEFCCDLGVILEILGEPWDLFLCSMSFWEAFLRSRNEGKIRWSARKKSLVFWDR